MIESSKDGGHPGPLRGYTEWRVVFTRASQVCCCPRLEFREERVCPDDEAMGKQGFTMRR